jgi:hypothetical protein
MFSSLLIGCAMMGGVARSAPPETQAPISPPPAPAPSPSPGTDKSAVPKPAPTLDELLGLKPDPKKGSEASKAGEKTMPPTASDLDRKLSPQEAKEKFEEAVALMGDTATRLQKSKDTGIDTQRLQEDIVRRLDMVIREAEQNRQQSKSQKQKQKQQQQDQSQQQQQQQSQSPKRRDDPHNSDSRDNLDPPAARPAELNPELAAKGQAWGALPQRVREALLQGTGDKYSTLYQRLTEQYYRKLAEEGKK